MTEKYEYCSTITRTFVQDCSPEIGELPDLEKNFLSLFWLNRHWSVHV